MQTPDEGEKLHVTVNRSKTINDAAIQGVLAYSLTFRIRRVGCHSNETRAPIANPPNNAQLGAPPTIPQSYIRVRAVVQKCGEGQTDRQMINGQMAVVTARFA